MKRITRERALEVIDISRSAEGRTLVGRALRYNQQDIVSDDGGRTHYVETWLPRVFARSLSERGERIPLLGRHKLERWPFGVVRAWQDTDEHLGFEAKVSRTRDGDELLELIIDGAVSGISVGCEPKVNREVPYGVERVEAVLLELSVCTIPQIDGARILSVREAREAEGLDVDDHTRTHTHSFNLSDLHKADIGKPEPVETPALDEARAFLATLETQ